MVKHLAMHKEAANQTAVDLIVTTYKGVYPERFSRCLSL